MIIVDPLKFEEKDLPLIVFSDDMRSFFSWSIKAHSKGNYSHVMMMIQPGKFVTQGWTYKEVPAKTYLKKRFRLKFWKPKGLSATEQIAIYDAIHEDLKRSWWRRSYDWLGIVGQFFKVKWFNNPYKDYCTERVGKYLRMIPEIKSKIPLRTTPAELNRVIETLARFKVYGYWVEPD